MMPLRDPQDVVSLVASGLAPSPASWVAGGGRGARKAWWWQGQSAFGNCGCSFGWRARCDDAVLCAVWRVAFK